MIKNKPKIRFVEYTNAWEQRELGEVADIIGGGTPSTTVEEYWNGEVDWYSPAEIGEQIFVSGSQKKITQLGLDKSSAKILPVGTVLFTSRAGIGNTAILAKEGATNQGFQSILPMSDILDSYFIFSRTHELKRYGEVTGAGSTFVEVSGKQMSRMPLFIPIILEQKKIGDFFKHLDQTTTLHQRKLDKTKELKKTMLSKMFPKSGQDKPELRFNKFTEGWELCMLGDIADIVGGGTPSTENPEYWSGDIEWYSPVEINDQIYVNKSRKTITEIGLKKSSARILPVGTVLFTSRAGIGNTAILAKEGCTNQGFQSIIPKSELLDSYFIFSRTPELKRYGEIYGAGSTFIEVSGKQMQKMQIFTPSLSEQLEIGTFFQSLDNLITIHQRELEKLKLMKQYLLKNMFV